MLSSNLNVLTLLPSKVVTMISCGDFHTLALDNNGQVWSWGGGKQQHNRGQFGHGDNEQTLKPKQIAHFMDKRVKLIAAGGYHSLVVTQEQTVYGWGDGRYG